MQITFKMKKKANERTSKPLTQKVAPEAVKTCDRLKCVYDKHHYTHCCFNSNKLHGTGVTNLIQLNDGRIASSSGISHPNGQIEYFITIWSYPAMKAERELIGHNGLISCLIQLNNGNVASCGYDRQILLYDILTTGKVPIIALQCTTMMVHSVVELKDGTIASSETNAINIWDITSKQSLFKLKRKGFSFTHLCYLADKDSMIAGTFKGSLLICSTSSSSLSVVQEYAYHSQKITFVALLSKERVAACSGDGTISVIDLGVKGDEERLISKMDIGKCSKCVVEISETFIASGDYEGVVIIWDIVFGIKALTIFANSIAISSLLKTNDNLLITGASSDSNIKIWC